MRNYIIILILTFSTSVFSQNWNVFNKNYRYNYKYNYSQLVSNVLFADTVKQSGSDTIYIMNNIGVVTGSVLTLNKPQFLMKKIIKQANGIVKLQDTTNITIVPTCMLNQSWLFDSNYNLTATCVATSTETLFSIIDSVKTIVVNNADTIKLSKQFGIIQFPKLYGQNNYYRLAGIEHVATYDAIPFLGIKVPNAWDFYNFDVGDKWCNNYSYSHKTSSTPTFQSGCQIVSGVIMSKTIAVNGYYYSENVVYVSNTSNQFSTWCIGPAPYVPQPVSANITGTYSNLNAASSVENRMYPGMIAAGSTMMPTYGGIVNFGLDNNGTFYKYFGGPCQQNGITILPNANVSNGTGLMFGAGLGKTTDKPYVFEGTSNFCVTCFTKGNLDYFGPFVGVNIKENFKSDELRLIYPNPASTKLNLNLVDPSNVRIYNSIGKIILEIAIDTKASLDISDLPNGMYFIELESDSIKTNQKLIIQH